MTFYLLCLSLQGALRARIVSDALLNEVRALLAQCTTQQQELIFRELRAKHAIHEYERAVGAPAEMILEAVHRAPELTRRMLRGVIADAAFALRVVPNLAQHGWKDVTPQGNFAFDYLLDDGAGGVKVQVKLQRSKEGRAMLVDGAQFGFAGLVSLVETQKTRTGTDGDDNKTRPYRFGEFDVLAVSMQPSTGEWDRFRYTLGRWLARASNPELIATMQPVTAEGEFWTEDFTRAVQWLRTEDGGKQMVSPAASRKPRVRRAKTAKRPSKKQKDLF